MKNHGVFGIHKLERRSSSNNDFLRNNFKKVHFYPPLHCLDLIIRVLLVKDFFITFFENIIKLASLQDKMIKYIVFMQKKSNPSQKLFFFIHLWATLDKTVFFVFVFLYFP